MGLGLDWCKFVKNGETLGQFFDLLYLELPYADAASPHKEHDRAHVGKQALGDKEIGSSQKKIMEVYSCIFPLDFSGFALRCPLPRELNKCPVRVIVRYPVLLKGSSDIGDAPSPRYMRERATWSGRVLRSEYLWAWRTGKRLA